MKKKTLLKITALLAVFILIFPLSSCGKGKYSATEYALFDADITIIGYDTSRYAFEKKASVLFDLFKEYDRLFDIYFEYEGINNLKTVNDNAGISPVAVDSEILDLIDFGIEIYEKTRGGTNIAMGSVLKIWHEYREDGVAVPTAELLKEADKHTDISSIVIDRENGTLFISDSEASIDVGAIAKGFATELVTQYAKKEGWTSMAISAGGNVSLTGPAENGDAWEIGIQNPSDTGENAVIETVKASSGAVVTSGSYRRYYEVDGVRYHHIIDPETLYPKNTYLSVTIICDTSAMADALSTALFNMNEEDGRALSKKLGFDAIWVYPDMTITKTY